MQRDMDLVRLMLLKVAALPHRTEFEDDFAIDGYGDDLVQYHLRLLTEAGMLRTLELSHYSRHIPVELTWAGQDALDAMRDNKLWQAAKDNVLKPLGGATFAVLLDYLKAKGKEALGLPP
jgi:hypothetical protein